MPHNLRYDITRPFWAIVIILFYAGLAIAFRNSSGIALLPFWGLAALYRFFTIKHDVPALLAPRARVLACVLAILLLVSMAACTLEPTDGDEEDTEESVSSEPATSEPENPLTVTMSSASAIPGETVSISVSIDNAYGVKSMGFIPQFDETVLELVSGRW